MGDVAKNLGHRIHAREIGKRLGVATNTVINLCKAGKGPRHVRLPPANDGGNTTWLFYEADVDAWILKHTVEEG